MSFQSSYSSMQVDEEVVSRTTDLQEDEIPVADSVKKLKGSGKTIQDLENDSYYWAIVF